MAERLLTLKQVQEKLSVSRTQLWKLRKQGLLPSPIMIGTAQRFSERAIDKHILKAEKTGKIGG